MPMHTPQAVAKLPRPARPARVLIVDDYADGAESAAVLLELCGYAVHTAATATACLALTAELLPDAIVIDPHLIGGGSDRPLTIVVHTSCSATECANTHLHGGDHLLPKPADPRELLDTLARLTAGANGDG
jgi:DNA-binding response OmpR family regulator